jgi:hypothetical protein
VPSSSWFPYMMASLNPGCAGFSSPFRC